MGDEHHFTEEEMEHLRWIHANPPPDIDLLGPCPEWCAGRPHQFRGDEPDTQSHVSPTMHRLYVATASDDETSEGERYWLLGAEIEWYPFSRQEKDREIAGLVYIDGGAPVEMTPDQIRALADSLAPQADRLREFADLLESLHSEDMPDQGNPPPSTWGDDWHPGMK